MTKLKEIWRKTIRMGVYENMSFLLKQRIFLSNFIGLLLAFVAFSYLSIVVIGLRGNFQAALALSPAVFFGLLVLFLNKLRLNILSRFIISLAPGLFTFFLNVSIKIYNAEQIGLVHYISPRFFIISTLVAPLVLFTTGELVYLIIALFIIISIGTWGYVWVHRYYQVWISDLNINDKAYLEVMTEDFTLVIITLIVVLLFSRILNHQYEKRNQKLLEDAYEKNEILNTREVKLRETLREIEVHKESQNQQNWFNNGLATFSQFMQEANTEPAFYQKLISEVVKHLDALQGAIYATEELIQGDKQLVCKGGYGLSIEKISKKEQQIEEGLLGKCIQSAKTILIQQIPEQYATFQTGTTQIKPQSLLIVTLKYRDYDEGVIEILSLHPFQPHQVAFLEKVAESIAAVLHSLKINQRTESLLENSKKMFAELEQQQRQWREKEKDYLKQISELQKNKTEIYPEEEP